MKKRYKLLLVPLSLIALSGCGAKVDLGPMIGIEATAPKLDDNLKVIDEGYKLTLNTADLEEEQLTSLKAVDPSAVGVKVDGQGLDSYKIDDTKEAVEITVDDIKPLNEAGFKIDSPYEFDLTNETNAKIISDHQAALKKQTELAGTLREQQPQMKVAQDLVSLAKDNGLKFAVIDGKYKEYQSQFGLKLDQYKMSNTELKKINNSAEFVLYQEVDNQKFVAFFDKDFQQVGYYSKFAGELEHVSTRDYFDPNGNQTQSAPVGTATIPGMEYFINGSEGTLYVNEVGFDKSQPIADVITELSKDEKYVYDKQVGDEHLTAYFLDEWNGMIGGGANPETGMEMGGLSGSTNDITIEQWMSAMNSTDGFNTFSFQVYDLLYNNYQVDQKLGEYKA